MAERVAFIGLGIMGRPMAENLLGAGFELVVFNRTAERAQELAGEFDGALVAQTAADAAAAAQIAITMVPDVAEVEEVVVGGGGVAEGLSEGGLVIDMSTIAPSASRRIAAELEGRGIAFLDAPVTGSRPKAEDGTLTIMAGGPEDAFERARPLFEAMGELVLHMGPHGHGSMIKLINNTVAAINCAALAEGLVLARQAELDTEAALKVIGAGSGNSAMLELKAKPMLDHDLDPLFKLEHMLKDVHHCLAEAKELGVELTLADTAQRLYSTAEERGLGEQDFAAVIEVAEASAAPPG